MDAIHSGWFSEIQNDLWPGQSFSLKVKKILHEERSKFQKIKILDTETYGRCLILDGIIQRTTKDEFAYQEMIAFLPLCCHPNPKKVLIVGGGDGGVSREVVKHPLVEEVYQVEIDDRVVELSKKYLPTMACGFNDKKLNLVVGSIVCSQGGSFWLDYNYIKKQMLNCSIHFPRVAYAVTSVPSYPCGQIGFVIGGLDKSSDFKDPVIKFSSSEIDAMNLKYYSSKIHSSAFTLPRWIEKNFYENEKPK
uniref:PABS domain-containing protein n=1 Tax=Glossina austeni TaxID=7395 RepID=A0A1A9VEN2_GLOAU